MFEHLKREIRSKTVCDNPNMCSMSVDWFVDNAIERIIEHLVKIGLEINEEG